jgi:hypothetical protein
MRRVDEKNLASSGCGSFCQQRRKILPCPSDNTHQNDTTYSKVIAYGQKTCKNGSSRDYLLNTCSFSVTKTLPEKILEMQFTAFPQNELTMCKTCLKKVFFVRKVNADSNLYQVEKKFQKLS